MPARLSNSQIAAELARRAGVTKDQAMALLQAQAELAYEQVDPGFGVPGIGVLKVLIRPERRMIMRFGPDAGKEITIPAIAKLRFSIAREAYKAVLAPLQGGAQAPADDELEDLDDQ